MGLDINAYRGLKVAPEAELDLDGYPEDYMHFVRINPGLIAATEAHFPSRTAGVFSGIFSFTEAIRFRAGSYSGYNIWRDWLAGISGWGTAERCWAGKQTEGPFYELINFSDCEGVIGPIVAAKLAKDFEEFADKAGPDERYLQWRKAFTMAADGGAVMFQ
jgi:hypothetical protein